MRINIIPIRELIISIIPIRFRKANTNRTNLFLMKWSNEKKTTCYDYFETNENNENNSVHEWE